MQVLFLGDSITGVITWFQTFMNGVNGLVTTGGNNPVTAVNGGVSGLRVSGFADPTNWYGDPTKRAALIDPYKSTANAVVIFLGVNDANTASGPVTPDANYLADYNTVVQYILNTFTALDKTAGANGILLISPWLYGALRPDGANPNDRLMDRFRDLTAMVASQNAIAFCDIRTPWWNDLETNVDPRYSVPGNVVDSQGIHPTSLGVNWISSKVLGHVLMV